MPKKSSFMRKPGYKSRVYGKKKGRVRFNRIAATKEYLYRKYPSLRRARKKDFAKRRAAKAKENAKRRRRDKKINRVVARVLTDMNDDAATMYRQSVDKFAHVETANGPVHLDGGTAQAITNGNFVSAKSPVLQALVKRNETNFFQVDAFHGMVSPSWKRYAHTNIPANRDGTKTDNQLNNEIGDTPTGTAEDVALGAKIDIRAFAEIELPFLPCIPKQIAASQNSLYRIPNELDQFCRTNNKIKIKNNYMRFRFFATANGEVVSRNHPNPFDNDEPTNQTYSRLEMDGSFTNIEPTFTYGGKYEVHEQAQYSYHTNNTSPNLTTVVPSNTIVYGFPNRAKEYKIAARRFAKVRIILYERDQEEEEPVKLEHFLRYGQHNMNPVLGMAKMPGGNMFVSEEYRLHKRFESPLKTKRDMLYSADTTIEERLMGGKIVLDKVLNLPMGKEVVYTCNPIAGTVLEYDDSDTIRGADNGPVMNTQTNANEIAQGLPLDVNQTSDLYAPKVDPLAMTNTADELRIHARKAEYKPKNKQYGMFMLVYCQRAGVEYDVFQKFQYDK